MLCHSTYTPWVNLNTRVTINFPQVSHNVHTYGTNSLAPVSVTTNKKIISQANPYQVPHREQRLLVLYITDDTHTGNILSFSRKHLPRVEASGQHCSDFPRRAAQVQRTKREPASGASPTGCAYDILYIFKS